MANKQARMWGPLERREAPDFLAPQLVDKGRAAEPWVRENPADHAPVPEVSVKLPRIMADRQPGRWC